MFIMVNCLLSYSPSCLPRSSCFASIVMPDPVAAAAAANVLVGVAADAFVAASTSSIATSTYAASPA